MISIMRVTEMYDKDVFTDAGEYFGKVDDVVLGKFMINGWIIKSTPNSLLREALGDVRAVIVPHKAVRAVGDVILISHDIELSTGEEVEGGNEGKEEQVPSSKTGLPSFQQPSQQPPAGSGPARAVPFRF